MLRGRSVWSILSLFGSHECTGNAIPSFAVVLAPELNGLRLTLDTVDAYLDQVSIDFLTIFVAGAERAAVWAVESVATNVAKEAAVAIAGAVRSSAMKPSPFQLVLY